MCLVAAVRLFLWPAEGNLWVLAVEPVRKPMPRTVAVTGTVTLDGALGAGATVGLIPANPMEGKAGIGTTNDQGKFQLQTHVGGSLFAVGALPGHYVIVVSVSETVDGEGPQSDLPKAFGQVHSSPLRHSVVAGKPNDISHDLNSSESDRAKRAAR